MSKKKIRIPKRNIQPGFETVQVGTNINPDKLQVSEKRKKEIEYEVLVETANMSYEEIEEIVQGWIKEPYGNDEDIYKIFELQKMLNAFSRAESERRLETVLKRNENMFRNDVLIIEDDQYICRR